MCRLICVVLIRRAHVWNDGTSRHTLGRLRTQGMRDEIELNLPCLCCDSLVVCSGYFDFDCSCPRSTLAIDEVVIVDVDESVEIKIRRRDCGSKIRSDLTEFDLRQAFIEPLEIVWSIVHVE